MPIYRPDGWDELTGDDWMVTWHYAIVGLWGTSHQEITLNVPRLFMLGDFTAEYGVELWKRVFAPAMSIDTRCQSMMWTAKGGVVGWLPNPDAVGNGGALTPSAGKDHAAVIMLEHGHVDRWGTKPLFLPGFPANLIENGLLTHDGLRRVERIAHIMAMGMVYTNSLNSCELYQRWPVEGPDGQPLFNSYAVRRVTGFRVMYHTARAPDYRAPF